MKEYRVRINNEKLSRTISADSFMMTAEAELLSIK